MPLRRFFRVPVCPPVLQSQRRRPRLELVPLESRLIPATFTVDLATDNVVAFGITAGKLDMGGQQTGPDSGDLRWCLSQANMTPGADDIVFDPTVFPAPSAPTIALNQLLVVYDDVAIHGVTAANLTVSGQNLHRVFYVNNGTVSINDLTIANGLARGGNGSDGGGGGAGLGGGMLINGGSVTLTNVTFSGNQAVGGNGAAPGALGGGGGGAGGNAASVGVGTSGGGGFLGNSGLGDPSSVSSGGGGGGFTGTGGAGHNGVAGGNGTAIGGGGGSGTPGGTGSTGGGDGSTESGGGGGSTGFAGSSGGTSGTNRLGGTGGFGGGGGGGSFSGGTGGDYGGGGGGGQLGGTGGFGGGGGDGNSAGAGGFGGGGGGGQSAGGSGGQFGGAGADLHSGGGGAGLGGAIFERAGTLILINTTFNNNTATGGAAGGGTAAGGQGKGGALFINSGAAARSSTAATSFSGNTAADAGSTTTNPQDNANVFGTLVVGGSLTATAGTPQITAVNTDFGQDLQVTLLDGNNSPVAGEAVTFSAPGSGASATFPSGTTFTTDAAGHASAPVDANGTVGTYSVQAAFAGLTATFSLTNGQAPAITSNPAATFTVGQLGSFTVTATGSPAPTFGLTGAPAWLSINSTTGELTGTPPNLGAGPYSFTFTVTATNGVTPDAPQKFTLTVNQAPSITSAAIATFTTGTAGNFAVTATGFPAPTFSEVGALPSGVTLASDGTLAGTPDAGTGGVYPFTITATNGVNPDATQAFTLTVDQPPAITSANSASFTAGTADSFNVTATGFPAATLSESGPLPNGVTFTDNGNGTATLAGTPTRSGTFALTITAANGVSPDATQSFTLSVAAVAQAITFPAPHPVGFAVGRTVPLAATASSGLPVAYTVVSGPGAVSGSLLTVTGVGTVVAEADQPGDAIYSPAAPVTAEVVALPVDQNAFPLFTTSGNSDGVTVHHPDGSTASTAAGVGGDGARAALADVTGDGVADTIIASGPGVSVLVQVIDGRTGAVARTFSPFEAAFTGGAFVAAGDVNGDGKADVAVSADTTGGARVVVYDGATGAVLADFLGIDDPDFRGGARVALGDVNGDGLADLIVAAGTGGGPRVAVYDGASLRPGVLPAKLVGDFFAFEDTLRDGVFVSAGDVNGDGKADLIFGGGSGGGPRVLIWDAAPFLASSGATRIALADFFAADPATRSGARVAAKNLDGDAFADLVVGVPVGATSTVADYLGKTITPGGTPPVFAELDPGVDGVFVG